MRKTDETVSKLRKELTEVQLRNEQLQKELEKSQNYLSRSRKSGRNKQKRIRRNELQQQTLRGMLEMFKKPLKETELKSSFEQFAYKLQNCMDRKVLLFIF
jgi:hypothetical protein